MKLTHDRATHNGVLWEGVGWSVHSTTPLKVLGDPIIPETAGRPSSALATFGGNEIYPARKYHFFVTVRHNPSVHMRHITGPKNEIPFDTFGGHTLMWELGAATRGIGEVALRSGKPVAFGVLTVDTLAQAQERSADDQENKGAEAAMSAVEMVNLLRALRD